MLRTRIFVRAHAWNRERVLVSERRGSQARDIAPKPRSRCPPRPGLFVCKKCHSDSNIDAALLPKAWACISVTLQIPDLAPFAKSARGRGLSFIGHRNWRPDPQLTLFVGRGVGFAPGYGILSLIFGR